MHVASSDGLTVRPVETKRQLENLSGSCKMQWGSFANAHVCTCRRMFRMFVTKALLR